MVRHVIPALIALAAPGLASDCQTTAPPNPPFVAPAPYAPNPDRRSFWYGSDVLWTVLRIDDIWDSLPHDARGYSQKIAMWSKEYDRRTEPEPALVVTGKRLDGNSPLFNGEHPTHAGFADGTTAMLVGVNVPTTGCWEITGRYRGHELSFVVEVQDERSPEVSSKTVH
jgi:hypothetical protein